MAEPQAVARILTDIIRVDATGGEWLADLRGFDSTERAELCDALRSEGVGLADRSKLRILATIPETPLWQTSALVSESRTQVHSTRAQFAEPTARASPRQLQESGGSMDSIALAVTALLGIASYLVQTKISRDAERSQKESDRKHTDNARAEARAENQLARVMTQMERFVAPLNTLYVQMSHAMVNTMGEVRKAPS